MKCYNCGNEVTTQGTNCPFCGSPMSAAAGNIPGSGYQQQQRQAQPGQAQLDAKTAAIVCYCTWIGFIIAIVMGNKNDPFFKHHLNNALIIAIAGTIFGIFGLVPLVGWIFALIGSLGVIACIIIGIIGASAGQYTNIPVISDIKIIQ